ncbi:MAG: VOC family protein [Armatimonadota bacterium]
MTGRTGQRLPVTHLDHVTFRVSDPDAAAEYYRRVLGLGITGRDASTGAVLMSTLPAGAQLVPHHELVLYPGEPFGLAHYALAVRDEGALDVAAAMLRSRGLTVEGPAAMESVHGPAVRLQDDDGLYLELVIPDAPVARPAAEASPANLLRLSHINLRSPHVGASARWLEDHLDLRLSDRIPDEFYWLRCGDEHTTVALVRSSTPGLHHVALEIASWSDMLRMLDHFGTLGVQVEYGPGRHGPGNSLFVYFVDPWNIRWELLAESVRFDGEGMREAGVWDPVRGRVGAVNLWGPRPPESFIRG